MTKKTKLKKSVTTYVKTVVRNISTFNGTVHFTEKKGTQFILWCVLMAANGFLTVCFIFFVNHKYNNDQILTEINANCKVSQVPFPAVAICNFNSVSERESNNIRQLLKRYNIADDDITSFLRSLDRLKNYNANSSDVPHFLGIMNILKRHYYDVDILMEEVHQKCENLLLYCSFNRRQQKCSDIFNVIKTMDGHCCAFNYAAIEASNQQIFITGNENIEYYDDETDDSTTLTEIVATSESGRMSGLHVLLNVEPDDYASWASVPYYGGKVILSDPHDFPETTILYQLFAPGDALDLKIVPMIFQADPNIKSVDPAVRNCWYHDEVDLAQTDRYSYETCHTECKMHTYERICGCIPYKYPKEQEIRMCEFSDLACLQNVTIHISDKDRHCNPPCRVECTDKRYAMTSTNVPFLASFEPELPPGTNVSHVTALRVYYEKSTCNCYKMRLLIDLNFIIATFGGVFSLGFGGSLISVIELIIVLLSTLYIMCCDFLSDYVTKLRRRLFASEVQPYAPPISVAIQDISPIPPHCPTLIVCNALCKFSAKLNIIP